MGVPSRRAVLALALVFGGCGQQAHSDGSADGGSDTTAALDVGGGDGVCGDAVLDEGEACDDGNDVSGDGCSSSCQLVPGEAVWCAPLHEQPGVESLARHIAPFEGGAYLAGVISPSELPPWVGYVSSDGQAAWRTEIPTEPQAWLVGLGTSSDGNAVVVTRQLASSINRFDRFDFDGEPVWNAELSSDQIGVATAVAQDQSDLVVVGIAGAGDLLRLSRVDADSGDVVESTTVDLPISSPDVSTVAVVDDSIVVAGKLCNPGPADCTLFLIRFGDFTGPPETMWDLETVAAPGETEVGPIGLTKFTESGPGVVFSFSKVWFGETWVHGYTPEGDLDETVQVTPGVDDSFIWVRAAAALPSGDSLITGTADHGIWLERRSTDEIRWSTIWQEGGDRNAGAAVAAEGAFAFLGYDDHRGVDESVSGVCKFVM